MSLRNIVNVLLLWTLIHCIQGLVSRTGQDPCARDFFRCNDGRCIRRSDYCDGETNCFDATDELYCYMRSQVPCPTEWLRCADNRRCYPLHWRCDGHKICNDNSDEWNCDGIPCSPDVFRCSNDMCIERSKFCNGVDDCRDNTDERLCYITTREPCSPGSSRCADDTRCFPSHWRCDGTKDCLDGSDEGACGSNVMKLPEVAKARERLITWFKQRRKSGSISDKWGSQLHRVAVALHLANDSTFSPGSTIGQEISYELNIQLLRCLSKEKKMSSLKLALYIHAMMAVCMDPRDFFGKNLVLDLRKRTEENANYTNPFQILVLCNAGDIMTSKDAKKVTAAFNSQHRPFWTGTKALAILAIACLSSKPNLVTDEKILNIMQQELKSRQLKNGTVDNPRTTALVLQALLVHDSYNKDFNIDSAIHSILESVKSNTSLLNAYYALPALSNKSLLNISSIHCKKAPESEIEALEKVLDGNEEVISVQYSIWIGDNVELSRNWQLKTPLNNSIYDVMETIAKIDNRQKVEYSVMEGKPFVTSVAGLEDDPETGMFWFLHVKTINSDEELQIIEQSPVDVKLKPNQEIILWYKSGSWNALLRDTKSISGITKPNGPDSNAP